MTDVTDWRLDLTSGKAIAFPDVTVVDAQEDSQRGIEVRTLLDALPSVIDDQFSMSTEYGRYRGQRVNQHVFALRKINETPLRLSKLGFHNSITHEILKEDLRTGGLVLVAGPPGTGKTTTAAAILQARLEVAGGYSLAIEDPVEYQLAGMLGRGYCDQVEASGPADYRAQVVSALRKFPAKTPGILFLGEVRDEVTATEAIKIGIAGFLVITTLHSVGTITAIQRLLAMMGGEDSAPVRAMLADALRLVLFQRWDQASGRIVCEMLPASDLVRGAIKNGKFDAIKDELHRVRMMQARS